MNQLPLFAPQALSVSDLTRYMQALVESDEILRDVWVQGEISNLATPSSGHIYFTLKDSTSALKCVIWRTQALRMRMKLQSGMAVEAHGAIGIYERDGQYQLYVDAVRLSGEGRLYQEFLRLKALLDAEGLFEPERKRPIPERPAVIGIVTSPTGAALQDILNTLRRRYPLAEVLVSPTAVQGEEAPAQIVTALRRFRRGTRPDVILLARGGGSLEDLWAFNDERVVRAVAESPIPVITGVGHETDFTLADFAADLRAPTPTAAAELATPDAADLRAALVVLNGRMEYALQAALQNNRSALEGLGHRLNRVSPAYRVRTERQNLDGLETRARLGLVHRLQMERSRYEGSRNHLRSLNPLAVMQRGFAVVTLPDGSVARSSAQLQAGDEAHVRLAQGSFEALVNKVNEETSRSD